MPSRRPPRPLLGACGIAVPALLAAGGAAARPGGVWLGVPGGRRGRLARRRAALALARVAGRPARVRRPPAPRRAPARRERRSPACGRSPGRRSLALALAGRRARRRARRSGGRAARLFLPLVFARPRRGGRPQRTCAVGPEGDEPHYLMVAESLLRDGDVSLERDYAEGRYRASTTRRSSRTTACAGKGGAIYSLHAVGLSVLILPAWALGGLRGRHRLHGAPRRAPGARGARVGPRADRARGAGRGGGLGGRALAAARPLRRPRVHRGARGARAVVRPAPRPRRRGSASAGAARRRPRRGRSAVAERALRAARRPRGRPRALAAPAARASLLAAARCRPSRPRRPRWPTTRRSTASSTRAASTAAARSSRCRRCRRACRACCSTRSSASSSTRRSSRWRCPGFALLWRRDRRLAIAARPRPSCVVLLTAGSWHMWRGGFNPPARFLVPIVPAPGRGRGPRLGSAA